MNRPVAAVKKSEDPEITVCVTLLILRLGKIRTFRDARAAARFQTHHG